MALSNITLAEWFSRSWNGMGTRISTEVWAASDVEADIAFKRVKAEMDRIEENMSIYIEDSELSRVNKQAHIAPVKVTDELFGLLERARYFSELSDGAFDITFASIGHQYDYRKGLFPSDKEIAQGLPAIDYRWVVLDEASQTVFFKHPNVKVDLGGIAKGYGIDKAAEQLVLLNINNATISAGGDTLLIGDRKGRPWMVGIRDPRSESANAVVIPLESIAISTSGDYERYFIDDGERYHHIISPKTGKSADKVQSASIIGPNATTTDVLSTTIFVLGPEKGLELVERLKGIDAIIIDNDRKMHYSSELQPPSQ